MKDITRELREAGVPEEAVPELAELAEDLEKARPVQPRPEWSHASKERLLRKFDEKSARTLELNLSD